MARNKTNKSIKDARNDATPYNKLKKDPGVPRLPSLKKRERAHDPKYLKSKAGDVTMGPPAAPSATIASLALQAHTNDASNEAGPSSDPLKAQRDNTVSAHAHQFKKVLDLSDVVIQVLDARDPMGCRSRLVEDEVRQAAGEKMMILALNKTDLVPKENVQAWLRYLRHDHPTVPLKSSTASHRTRASGPSSSTKNQGAPHLLTLLKSFRRAHTSLTIGVVGPPNVGKSSLINSLSRLRNGGKGGDVCTVGAKPGETRTIKEVGLEKGIKVLDMPGIVWGDFLSDGPAAADGSAPPNIGNLNMMGVEYLEDPVGAVEAIVARVPSETLQQIYNVPPFANCTEFLVMVALLRGRLGKGGTPDQLTAARSILNDWNAGSIPYHTVPPTIHPSSIPSVPNMPINVAIDMESDMQDADPDSALTRAGDVGEAKYVAKFSQPFDLAGLFSLTDRDVLDDQPEKEEQLMEGLDVDEPVPIEQDADEMQSDDLAPSVPLKRAHSPALSMMSSFTSTTNYPGGREPKPKQRRVRYNPNAPLVFEPQEVASMSSRKKQREDSKKKKRSQANGMVIDDDSGDLEMELKASKPLREGAFVTKPSAFAALACEDVPLPEDEDEEL